MDLFSEIYSCYYQVMRHLLCSPHALSLSDIRRQIGAEGFEESLLAIIPKITEGTWNLFERRDGLYYPRICSGFLTPLTALERAYLKALLADPRIGLFLRQEQQNTLEELLKDTAPLWRPEQFYDFDRFTDGDPYTDETYRRHFQTLLFAQKHRRYVEIDYTSPKGKRLHHRYLPARLEYSAKNDKFRLLALKHTRDNRLRLEILNLSRMQTVLLTDKASAAPADINAMIRRSYYKEPLTLHIVNRRNALERAMLHFANYEKNTRKLDEDTYECRIYYNESMETELVIEVLSFGPMLTVTGNAHFLELIKDRLRRQMSLAAEAAPCG